MATSESLRKLVHLGCKQIGLDNDTRRDLQLVATGKASMADMTDADLLRVVEALKQRGFKVGFPGRKPGRHPVAPRADLRLIHVLWSKLGDANALERPGRDGLNAFIRSRFEGKWQAVPIDVDTLRDSDQINDVIRALKDWCKRKEVPLQ
ncbi:gp16 family protein [Gemmobacter serpentinus]|uniref:gp16 family protein n=1 Tax=Gemmobacter serpentinus TaxID=2652247 RepID=UPI00124C8A94|nr:regulatory protein GemA [Gemmobacter serpentinus]